MVGAQRQKSAKRDSRLRPSYRLDMMDELADSENYHIPGAEFEGFVIVAALNGGTVWLAVRRLRHAAIVSQTILNQAAATLQRLAHGNETQDDTGVQTRNDVEKHGHS